MSTPVVLAMDFGGTKIAVAVGDVDGTRLGTATVETRPDLGARSTLERGIAAGRTLLGQIAADHAVIAVGVSTFGIPGDDGVALAPAVPGWGDLALGHELREAFDGAEICLATDVKAAAQAETEYGALKGCNPGIYLNLGTGLAAAIVVDGRVLTGRHGAAGEIGYNLRSPGDVGATERVLLEDVVSGQGLRRLSSAPDVFEAGRTDPDVAGKLDAFLDELAFHLVNLTNAVDPQRIAVGGGMVRSWHRIEPALRRALAAAVPFPPELVLAEHPYDAPLVGALALGTTAARERLTRGAPAWAG